MSAATKHRHVKLLNAGADGPEPVRCLDCGWTGRRVYPRGVAFQAAPCPKCGSRDIVLRNPEAPND